MKPETRVVTTKGQLVIPARLRRRFGIKRGTRVAFLESAGRIIVQPVTHEFIHRLRGSLKKEPSALASLLEARKRERTLPWLRVIRTSSEQRRSLKSS
jgi:AbrB family looped-hinge helix DNA binding protein